MSKWRAVLVGAMAAGALAAGSFIPAQADNVGGVPGVVHVDAGGTPSTSPSGHIVVQGDSNTIPAVGHGYIGVDSNQGVVGCGNGTYDGSGDNVITPIPPTVAPPGAPTGPCTPKP